MRTSLLCSLSLATIAGAQSLRGLPLALEVRSPHVGSCGTNRSSDSVPPISDLRRRLFGDFSFDKRATDCGLAFYCPATDVCCRDVGYSCCSATTCCAPGYACNSGSCIKDVVYTITRYSTEWVTSRATSTVISTLSSTYWTTTTDYSTLTTTSKNGVATSTIYQTSTKFENLKRESFPRETGVKREPRPVPAPMPTSPPVRYVGSSPKRDIIGDALAKFGLIEKRTSTATVYLVTTSTTFSYSYLTSFISRFVTATTGTNLVRTSIIFDGASTTVTVTSTIFVTVRTASPPPPVTTATTETTLEKVTSTITVAPPSTLTGSVVTTSSTSSGIVFIYPAAAAASTTPESGLSNSAVVGIAVGASVGGLILLAAVAAFCLIRHRRKSAAGLSDRSTIITTLSNAGPGGGGAMTESRTMSPATVSAVYPSGMAWADGKDVGVTTTPSPLQTSPTGHGNNGYYAPWPAPQPQPQQQPQAYVPQPQAYESQPQVYASQRSTGGSFYGQSELSAVQHSYGPSELSEQSLQELAAQQQHHAHHGFGAPPVEAPTATPAPLQGVYRPVPVRYGHQQQGSGGW